MFFQPLFLRLTPLPPAPFFHSIAVYVMGVGRVPLLVGSTLRLAILGPLGIRVEVVLHVFQGFVLFSLGLLG